MNLVKPPPLFYQLSSPIFFSATKHKCQIKNELGLLFLLLWCVHWCENGVANENISPYCYIKKIMHFRAKGYPRYPSSFWLLRRFVQFRQLFRSERKSCAFCGKEFKPKVLPIIQLLFVNLIKLLFFLLLAWYFFLYWNRS